MKFLISYILCLFVYLQSTAQSSDNNNYDSVLAKKLHADAYGMKKYVLVILKTGHATITDKSKLDSIFKGHMQNIRLLATQNKLIIAGPLGQNDKKYEGIFVLNTENINDAKKLLETDPAFRSGLLDADLYDWYGSAALQETLEIHKKIEKSHF